MSNSFQDHFERLKKAYPGRRLLIVSNTAGASSIDPKGKLAAEVENSTGVPVLPHSTKKPGCGPEIMEYFRKHPEMGVTRPDQIAIVGDRLTTDVMLANLMGSYAIWVKDGVVPLEQASIVSPSSILVQKNLADHLRSSRGWSTDSQHSCKSEDTKPRNQQVRLKSRCDATETAILSRSRGECRTRILQMLQGARQISRHQFV